MKATVKKGKMFKREVVSDTVIFMAAYSIDKMSKRFSGFCKKKKVCELLTLHHIVVIIADGTVYTPSDRFTYNEKFDYVNQSTTFDFENKSEEKKIISRISWLLTFRHSAHLLLDESLFHISFLIEMEPFLVSVNSNIIQVDSVAFCMNDVMFIEYELIEFKTAKPFDRSKCKGARNNFNILLIESKRTIVDA